MSRDTTLLSPRPSIPTRCHACCHRIGVVLSRCRFAAPLFFQTRVAICCCIILLVTCWQATARQTASCSLTECLLVPKVNSTSNADKLLIGCMLMALLSMASYIA